ncbi:cytochrome P450 [Streptomyces sp. GD-15H]|uniref:cytochrome P450 n=1 Tax=Streptomyces sp. GD-15H TaxID=3129112 RepID=UPI00324AF477
MPARCPHASAPATWQAGLFDALLTAETPLSRQQLQDEAITLLTGAIETTGATLVRALYEISRNPGIERLLRDELALVCADRPLRHEELDRLAHARRVLQEAIRKHGPAWRVTRAASRDIELGGHRIPEGADVVWNPCLHQHDPEVFPAPDVFDPDRWAPDRSQATRGSFLAFGDGRRVHRGELRLDGAPDHPDHRPADLAPVRRHIRRTERPGSGHRQAGQADDDPLARGLRRGQPAYTRPSRTT